MRNQTVIAGLRQASFGSDGGEAAVTYEKVQTKERKRMACQKEKGRRKRRKKEHERIENQKLNYDGRTRPVTAVEDPEKDESEAEEQVHLELAY